MCASPNGCRTAGKSPRSISSSATSLTASSRTAQSTWRWRRPSRPAPRRPRALGPDRSPWRRGGAVARGVALLGTALLGTALRTPLQGLVHQLERGQCAAVECPGEHRDEQAAEPLLLN